MTCLVLGWSPLEQQQSALRQCVFVVDQMVGSSEEEFDNIVIMSLLTWFFFLTLIGMLIPAPWESVLNY